MRGSTVIRIMSNKIINKFITFMKLLSKLKPAFEVLSPKDVLFIEKFVNNREICDSDTVSQIIHLCVSNILFIDPVGHVGEAYSGLKLLYMC